MQACVVDDGSARDCKPRLLCLQVLLGRYSRSDDVVVGTPLANRSRPELEGLIGYFVNSAALRTDLSGTGTQSANSIAKTYACLPLYQALLRHHLSFTAPCCLFCTHRD